MNVAVTDVAADMVTTHVDDEPEHAPPQPTKVESEFAVAVNVTDVPET